MEELERFTHPIELAHEAIVVELLELAVGGEEWIHQRVVAHERADLAHERSAHPGDPLFIVRRAAHVGGEGVAIRTDDERDGVGEGAVEVEEEGEWAVGIAARGGLVLDELVGHR